jgi:PAS domain S-box-containing protein
MDLEVSAAAGAEQVPSAFGLPGDAALFIDPDTDLVMEVSESMLVLLGRPRDNVVGSPSSKLGLWEEPLAGSLATEMVPHGDKRVLAVRVRARAARDPSGRMPLVPYRAMVEQLPAITYTEIPDPSSHTGTTVTYLSPAVETILGYTTRELLADPNLWDRITHPDDLPGVIARDLATSETGEPYVDEYRMFDRAGRIHWFRDRASLVRDDVTGLEFWQGVMIDVTEEKVAQERLRAAEERYRSLVETVPAIVYVDHLDEHATNVYTSPQTEAMLGITVEEWAADPECWPRMLHPEDKDRVMRASDAHTPGKVFDEVYRMVGSDGRIVWVRDVASTFKGADGEWYSHGILLDVSAQKETEEALREALEREQEITKRLREMDELKRTILHTLSHDLKSPLAAILGAATTVVAHSDTLGDQVRDELLEGVAERARRMDRLITDILALERLDRGLIEPEREPTDIGALCRRVVRECDVVSGREVSVEVDAVAGMVDAPRVERIVENLIVNAARHTPSDARIWVRAEMAPGGVELMVEDEGPGVPEELKEVIFESFRRGEGSEGGPLAAGSGIGLSLVSKYAQIHGGRAWVEDRPGGGASFHVLLPEGSA